MIGPNALIGLTKLLQCSDSKIRSVLPKVRDEHHFHPSLIVNGNTHTVFHADEPHYDGPGRAIVNVVVQGEGLLVFDPANNAGQTHGKFRGVWTMPGDAICFSGDLRLGCLHAVYQNWAKPFKLGKSSLTDGSARVILNFRYGVPTSTECLRFKDTFGKWYESEEKELLEEEAKKGVGREVKEEDLEEGEDSPGTIHAKKAEMQEGENVKEEEATTVRRSTRQKRSRGTASENSRQDALSTAKRRKKVTHEEIVIYTWYYVSIHNAGREQA